MVDIDIIINCLNHTWDIIGGDILQAEDINERSAGSIRRSHVIEVVMDCDYLETYNPKDKEQIAEFRKLSRWKQNKICKEAFPYKTYGY